MIFVIAGTQEPFDRMMQVIDKWAGLSNHDVFGQIAKAEYMPQNFPFVDFISPIAFNEKFLEADIIISHAGMGTIIMALEHQKPILIMPRLAKFGEHRNDHQLATAKGFEKLGLVNVAYNESELLEKLNLLHTFKPARKIGKFADDQLINTIRSFIKK
jgi:UDP-N-acetylglucosamine transferase subunit ALG13